jgi:hypothetical protein
MLSDIISSICEIEGLKKTNEWRSIKFVMPTKWPHRILAIMMSNDNRSIFLWDILYLRISKYLNRGHRSASCPSLPIHNGSYIPEINAQTWMNLMNIFSYSFLISLLNEFDRTSFIGLFESLYLADANDDVRQHAQCISNNQNQTKEVMHYYLF